jgi:hypothetical protein
MRNTNLKFELLRLILRRFLLFRFIFLNISNLISHNTLLIVTTVKLLQLCLTSVKHPCTQSMARFLTLYRPN